MTLFGQKPVLAKHISYIVSVSDHYRPRMWEGNVFVLTVRLFGLFDCLNIETSFLELLNISKSSLSQVKVTLVELAIQTVGHQNYFAMTNLRH